MSEQIRTNPGYDPATEPMRPEASLGELFGEMTSELSRIFRDEVELAKLETKAEARAAAKAGAGFGVGALAGYLCILFLSFALAWGLAEVMHIGWAFVVVGAIWGVVAAIGLSAGKKKAEDLHDPLPTTRQTIKEDIQWAKAQKS